MSLRSRDRPLRSLNIEQLNASNVFSQTGSVSGKNTVVVGGPGSGKTEVLTSAVRNALTIPHVSQKNLLVNTYTQSVSYELKQRLGLTDSDDLPIGTMHSIAYIALRTELDDERLVLSEEESSSLLDMAAQSLGGSAKLSYSAIDGADEIRCNRNGIHRSAYPIVDSRAGRNMQCIWKEYTRLKEAYKYMDFDDLLEEYRDFLACPASESYRERVMYVFIDEVQDNNSLQNEILSLLYNGGRTHIYAIGDDFQTIYGFRGSDVGTMGFLEKGLGPCDLHILRTNYRNPSAVINVSKALLKESGCKDREMVCVDNKPEKFISTQNRVPVYKYECVADECMALIKAVREDHHHAIEQSPHDGFVGTKQPSQLVLGRTNAILDEAAEAFRKNGIPFYRQQNKECDMQREFHSLLHIVINKNARLHENLLKVHGYTLHSLDDVRRSCQHKRVMDVVEFLLDRVYARETGRVESLGVTFRYSVVKTTTIAFERMDIAPSLAWTECQTKIASIDDKFSALLVEHGNLMKQQTWVKNVLRNATNIDGHCESLSQFISQSVIMNREGCENEATNLIRLMTIHQSKGLEADFVYVIGAHTEVYKAKNISETEFKEEVRVYNVAFTRSVKGLRVSWSSHVDNIPTKPFYALNKDCFHKVNYGATITSFRGKR